MTNIRAFIERYTEVWNRRDEAAFRTMVADGCLRHDPGASVAVSLEENVARFHGAHERFPGLRLVNVRMWEHGDDAITVCYELHHDGGSLAGLEVFRIAGDRIVEVWNTPPGDGTW